MEVHPYQPGQFSRRELPCLLAVLRELPPVAVVVVDGYVWLDGVSVAGLGAYLYQALAGNVAVIGVAKTRFAGAGAAVEVVRGRSTRPLFITAVGMSAQRAAEHVRSMHGSNRIPMLLKRADSLCRQAGCLALRINLREQAVVNVAGKPVRADRARHVLRFGPCRRCCRKRGQLRVGVPEAAGRSVTIPRLLSNRQPARTWQVEPRRTEQEQCDMKTSELVFIGIKGSVVALNRATGQQVWTAKLKGSYFVNVVLDGGKVLAACCGEIFCLDPLTGAVRWHNPLKGFGTDLATIATAYNPGSGNAPVLAEKRRLEEAAASGAVVGATVASS